jgi:hypothetical protein
MDSKKVRQLVKALNEKFENWDWEKALANSQIEATTRDYLIHPFLDLLNYDRIDDYTHEVTADLGKKKGKKVDVAITLGSKNPVILIECKKSTAKLNDNHYRQLREYCTDTNTAKIGILTNGIVYKFYTRNNTSTLQTSPFFEFDLSDYDNQDLETLSLFMRNVIDINSILEAAEETYFLDNFDEALYDTMVNPSEDLIKIIYANMGGKRKSDKIYSKIKELINGTSLISTSNRIIKYEASMSNSGIITTDEEIKAYNVIKTIMAMSSKFKNNDLQRISYRDLKGKFLVLFDDNQKKKICSLILKEKSKVVEIGEDKFPLEDTSIASITKLKKQLLESALQHV